MTSGKGKIMETVLIRSLVARAWRREERREKWCTGYIFRAVKLFCGTVMIDLCCSHLSKPI